MNALGLFLAFCGQPKVLDAPNAVRGGLVVCVEPHAARIGAAVMARGGNAVDAAVATALALAVTHPEAGNLGGGGFMVVRDGKTGACFTVDFREKAPHLATPTMYLDAAGRLDKVKAEYGWAVVGVPGSPMGFWTAHQKAGRLPWRDLVAPAIQLAAEGFAVDAALERSIKGAVKQFAQDPEARRTFLDNGQPPAVGSILKQPVLANTLWLLQEHGPRGFYVGEIAAKLDSAMAANGGLVRRADLAEYRAVIRAPVRGVYRGHDVISMGPPSSGGVALIEILNILEGYDLRKIGRDTPETAHLLVEAMRRAFHDRAKHLGDPDFAKIPVDLLLSKDHAAAQRRTIGATATPSAQLGADILAAAETSHTTHFSVVDSEQTMVAVTTTLEDSYGARVMAPGTGFLLNNEMHDFNVTPGVTDAKGYIGTPPNQIAPGKRMLSSMTPTLVLRDGKPFLVLGSPGGRTIINTVLQVIVNVVDHRMEIQPAVDAGRLHHQWMPDRIALESRLPAVLGDGLVQRGHQLTPARGQRNQGDCHAILIDPVTGSFHRGVDRRLRGAAAGF